MSNNEWAGAVLHQMPMVAFCQFQRGVLEHRPSVLKKHKGRRIPPGLREISSQLGRVKGEKREEEGKK